MSEHDLRDAVTTAQFRDWLAAQKQDPEFLAAYDALAAEYRADRREIERALTAEIATLFDRMSTAILSDEIDVAKDWLYRILPIVCDRLVLTQRTCDTCAYWMDDGQGHGLCEATWAKGSVPGAIWSRAVARNKTGRGTCWLETASDYGCNQWRQAGEG